VNVVSVAQGAGRLNSSILPPLRSLAHPLSRRYSSGAHGETEEAIGAPIGEV
jgi:hypothetical protein